MAQVLYLIGEPLDYQWLKEEETRWIVWDGGKVEHPRVLHLHNNLEEICSRFALLDYTVRSKDKTLESEIRTTSERIRFAAEHAFLKRPEAKVNLFLNFLTMHHSLWGNQLLGKFKGVPGVVCGAGPSLKKLENLKNKALVIAAGSAVNKDISPHLLIAGDPTENQGSLFAKQSKYEVPLIFTPTLNVHARYFHWGPQLLLTGAKPQKIQSWLEKREGIESEERWQTYSSSTLALHFLRLCGCSPIFLVGVDLSTDQLVDTKVDCEKMFSVDGCLTHWKWLLEAHFFGEYVKLFPDLKVWNSSEGGLDIKGVERAPLHFSRTYDLNNLLHLSLLYCDWKRKLEVHKSIELLRDSFVRMEKHFEGIEEIDLVNEPGYLYLLKESETVFKGILKKEQLSLLEERALINAELGVLTSTYLREILPN